MVNVVRLFRAPELAFWSAAVVGLSALLVVSSHLGDDDTRPQSSAHVAAVPDATASATRTQIDALASLMQSGVAAGTDPSALNAWAASIDEQAQAGLAARSAENAPSDDDLLLEFSTISSLSSDLQASSSDPVAATALRTQIGLHVSRLGSLKQGIPAPVLPTGTVDTFAGSTSVPSTPGVTAPSAPTVPAVPSTPLP